MEQETSTSSLTPLQDAEERVVHETIKQIYKRKAAALWDKLMRQKLFIQVESEIWAFTTLQKTQYYWRQCVELNVTRILNVFLNFCIIIVINKYINKYVNM